MHRKWTKMFLSVWLGLGSVLAATAQAQEVAHGGHRSIQVYPQAPCPAPCPAPAPHEMKPAPKPGDPARPDAAAAPTVAPADMAAPAAADTGELGGAQGIAGIEGRSDANSRFNLFDSMSAIPQNRVWTGIQWVDDTNFSTVGGGFGSTTRQNVTLYRFGLERALNENFSVGFQTQYVSYLGGSPGNDSWSNPQFMAKYVLRNECGTVISAVLGLEPETSITANEFRDQATRLYPGILIYREVSERAFVQGGFQFGMPIFASNDPYSFDYALSAGYWLYKHPILDNGDCGHNGCGASNGCCEPCCERRPLLTGIAPQVELLAHHVMGDATITGAFDSSLLTYEEQRHVLDVTLGTQVFLGKSMRLTLGYSRAITGGEARQDEILTTLQYRY